jgi:hypothetical protein
MCCNSIQVGSGRYGSSSQSPSTSDSPIPLPVIRIGESCNSSAYLTQMSSGPWAWRLPQERKRGGDAGKRGDGGDGEVAAAYFLSQAPPPSARRAGRRGEEENEEMRKRAVACFLSPSVDQIDAWVATGAAVQRESGAGPQAAIARGQVPSEELHATKLTACSTCGTGRFRPVQNCSGLSFFCIGGFGAPFKD